MINTVGPEGSIADAEATPQLAPYGVTVNFGPHMRQMLQTAKDAGGQPSRWWGDRCRSHSIMNATI